ncbi:carboxyl-terminal processing protease [Gracilibacillus ureilyticus]|uniref:Carboxyl-terminal processing protease n=1 Tax=Gracilibacillus ureilyticus TaxID=531814 RepID=A0A1H9UIC7_9BACI|nr:S41 family peptidase [Gracilibacillus ureilyticus]SES08793.1 carboxyl-terminal processing protease [Gracilibacillus ureilyticus]
MESAISQSIHIEERLFILSKAYESVSKYFAHWEDSKIALEDLDTYFPQFIKRVLETENRLSFTQLMLEFLAKLNNRHTIYFDLSATALIDWDDTENILPIGFSFENIKGEWIVTESLLNGLTPGDQILTINGQPFKQLVGDFSKYLHELHDLYRTGRLNLLFPLFMPAEKYSVEFFDKDNVKNQIEVNPYNIGRKDVMTEGRWLVHEKTAYIKIPSFQKPKYEADAVDFVGRFFSAKSIILDLRGNKGGSTPASLIKLLMNQRWRSYGLKTATKEYQPVYIEPDKKAYGGELILLVDRDTGSAAEDLVVPFKDNGRAKIIGERTWGSTGQPYIFEKGEQRLCIGAVRASMPDGGLFEGIGIEPDIRVNKRREDFYERIDRYIEEALRLSLIQG